MLEPDLIAIDELELSVRAYNACKQNGIETLGQLMRLDDSEILRWRQCGKRTLAELRWYNRGKLGHSLAHYIQWAKYVIETTEQLDVRPEHRDIDQCLIFVNDRIHAFSRLQFVHQKTNIEYDVYSHLCAISNLLMQAKTLTQIIKGIE